MIKNMSRYFKTFGLNGHRKQVLEIKNILADSVNLTTELIR